MELGLHVLLLGHPHRESEVAQFQDPRAGVHDHVLGFDVSVDAVDGVEVGQGLQHLVAEVLYERLWQAIELGQDLSHTASRAVLHQDPHVQPIRLVGTQVRDDVLVLQPRHHLHLLGQDLQVRFVLHLDSFGGEQESGLHVHAAVHGPKPTLGRGVSCDGVGHPVKINGTGGDGHLQLIARKLADDVVPFCLGVDYSFCLQPPHRWCGDEVVEP
mmetsp:Transcript_145150/g.253195  ORF Transcript_145150/g.253195 Transcript_145150/m.253195 type:complete len:214 (-) Transcript_145150:207-848(-)